MPRLTWDGIGERGYEYGVSQVVLYTKLDSPIDYVLPITGGTASTSYSFGVSWNGIISIDEKSDGAEPTDVWTEDYKYDTLRSPESLSGTITAYMYPNEFGVCDGSSNLTTGITIGQQNRRSFALCYRTEEGNESEDTRGRKYKLHVIYGASVSPTERNYASVNESPEAMEMSWDFGTVPIKLDGYGYISSIIFDTAYLDSETVNKIESCLYGTATTYPTLPDPEYLLQFVGGMEYHPEMLTDTYFANATEADILLGKTAFVKGRIVVGGIPSKDAQIYRPGTSTQTISAGYYLSGNQYIEGDVNLLSDNIRYGISIFGIDGNFLGDSAGVYTGDATASTNDILYGKTAYVNGDKLVGTMSIKDGSVYTPGTIRQFIMGGYYLAENQIIEGDINLNGANIRPGVSIFGVVGSIPSYSASSYMPSRTSIVLSGGYYLGGNQIIMGDSNLLSSNIRVGVSIFGVDGTYVGSGEGGIDTTDATATANDILYGKTAYVNGNRIVGAISTKNASSYVPRSTRQYIDGGIFLGGSQIIEGDSNLTPINIRPGVSIFGVTGDMPTLPYRFYNPGSMSITISSEYYLAGAQVINGDENLIPENIKNGTTIFGVTGTIPLDKIITRSLSGYYVNNDVSYIGDYAFYQCSMLTGVEFRSASEVSEYAFYNCSALESVIIPSCEIIGKAAFYNCTLISEISMPRCSFIDNEAFLSCAGITSVVLAVCNNIGVSAFKNCANLSHAEAPICSIIRSSAFEKTALRSADFPACKDIEAYAFGHCTRLRDLSFPDCYTIGQGTFEYCGLISSASFLNCHTIYANAFYACDNMSYISFPNCERILASAFAYCDEIPEASFPKCSIIGNYAFYGCRKLTAAVFPSCTEIGDNAFNGCYSLNNISFPICTTIGSSAFWYCSNITECSFPACVEIGESAFVQASKMEYAQFQECEAIGSYAFMNCTSLSTAIFPKCKSVEDGAFMQCTSLSLIQINPCSKIGQMAFRYCTSLKTAFLSECLEIGSSAYYMCNNLSQVELSKCKTIYDGAFHACTSLGFCLIPACEEIRSEAFEYCCSLRSLELPICSKIGASAFYQCFKLTGITLRSNKICMLENSDAFNFTPIGGYTVSTNGEYGYIYVPQSLYNRYLTAENWSYFSTRLRSIT